MVKQPVISYSEVNANCLLKLIRQRVNGRVVNSRIDEKLKDPVSIKTLGLMLANPPSSSMTSSLMIHNLKEEVTEEVEKEDTEEVEDTKETELVGKLDGPDVTTVMK